jgi:hypothetical protein
MYIDKTFFNPLTLEFIFRNDPLSPRINFDSGPGALIVRVFSHEISYGPAEKCRKLLVLHDLPSIYGVILWYNIVSLSGRRRRTQICLEMTIFYICSKFYRVQKHDFCNGAAVVDTLPRVAHLAHPIR